MSIEKTNSNYIVACLDILGYQNLVNNTHSVDDIDKIKNAFEETLNVVKKMSEELINESDSVFRKANKDIFKKVSFRLISDTFLISMPLDNCDFSDTKIQQYFNVKERIESHIISFLAIVTIIYYRLSMNEDFGYFMRGGISVGEHCEYPLPSIGSVHNTFLFSKTFIECYDLAENKAKYIRVLVSDKFLDFVGNLSMFENIIFYDKEGLRCLNIYSFLAKKSLGNTQILGGIKNNLLKRIGENRTKPYILEKYRYFVEYHNQKLSEQIQSGETQYKDYLIDITKI